MLACGLWCCIGTNVVMATVVLVIIRVRECGWRSLTRWRCCEEEHPD